jgi:hypothetical protein
VAAHRLVLQWPPQSLDKPIVPPTKTPACMRIFCITSALFAATGMRVPRGENHHADLNPENGRWFSEKKAFILPLLPATSDDLAGLVDHHQKSKSFSTIRSTLRNSMRIRVLSLSKIVMRVLMPLMIFTLIFYAQVELGYEIGLFPLYMIPVAQLSWDFGWKGTLVSVLLAVFLWTWSSILSEQLYSVEWYRYYNAAIRGVVYLVFGVFILLLKRTFETHRRRMEAMQAMLNVCHGCGALQGSDGRWIPMDQLLNNTTSPNNECPTCSRKAGD